MKIRKRIKKIMSAIAAFALALAVALPIFSATLLPASAIEYKERANEYDSTNVAEDLGDSVLSQLETVGGDDLKIYSFMEYCYSNSVDILNTKYGLYIYMYNPDRKEFSRQLGANTINMATSYNEGGAPDEYTNLMLKYCGHTTGKYDKLVYKFRVMGLNAVVENALVQESVDGERRYDVAGVQLLEVGTLLPVDYGVSRTFFYSGYAVGCGSDGNTESTLECRNVELETIKLDVNHTNYRTGTYNYEHICDELHTAYFSIEEKFFTNYGGLQKITADWYEYKTKPIFVTSDSNAYAALYEKIGVDIGTNCGDHIDGLLWRVLWEQYDPTAAIENIFNSLLWPTLEDDYFHGSYNCEEDKTTNPTHGRIYTSGNMAVPCIDWLFEREGATSKDSYAVSRDELLEYMSQTYLSLYPNKAKLLGKYPSDLFEESIDEDRISLLQNPEQKSGKVKQQTIDAGSKIDLLYAKKTAAWVTKWFGIKSISYDTKAIDPIVVIDGTDNIRSMTPDAFAKQYYINPLDADKVYNYCLEQIDAGRRAVLFRFANTDYYCSNARFDKDGGMADDGSGLSNEDGYVAKETVFLNFDIISLTFRNVNVDTVIPCVSDPIDIVSGLEAEREMDKDSGLKDIFDTGSNGCGGCDGCGAKKIFGLIVLVLVVAVVFKLVMWLREKWMIKTAYKRSKPKKPKKRKKG